MSHWHLVDKQLRCWTPRAPSSSLRARLFGAPPSREGPVKPSHRRRRRALSARHPGAAWHWLAPAMAVFLLGLFVLGNHSGALPQLERAPSRGLLATAALTRPELSAYYASARHSDNNALRNTFEWTNESASLTSAPPMAQTNSVIP